MSDILFSVAFKYFYLCSCTCSGVVGYNLIYGYDICTSYSKFIFTNLFFESLISRMSFATFSVGGSSSPTFTSRTVLQLSSMAFSNYSCCWYASSLFLATSSNFFLSAYFSFSIYMVITKVRCSHSCSSWEWLQPLNSTFWVPNLIHISTWLKLRIFYWILKVPVFHI